MTESEADAHHALIRAGRAIRGSIFAVKWASFHTAPVLVAAGSFVFFASHFFVQSLHTDPILRAAARAGLNKSRGPVR